MVISMNHELRTPLNAIEHSLVQIKSHLNPNGLKYFDIMTTSVKYLIYLVQDTLDFALIRRGLFKLNFEAVNIAKIL